MRTIAEEQAYRTRVVWLIRGVAIGFNAACALAIAMHFALNLVRT